MLFGSKQPVVAKASTIVNKPVDYVFKFIGDGFFENYPRWSPEVLELKPLTEGPIKLGAMAKQVRVDMGHRSESTFKVTEYQPGRRVSFSGVSAGYRCVYELETLPAALPATRLAFTFELTELEMYMRPFEKLIRVALHDGAQRTVKNLKGLIESQGPSQSEAESPREHKTS